MRICYVTTSFIRSADDYYSYFIFEQALSAMQANPGTEVVVIAPHAPGYKLSEEIQGIQIRRFPYFYPLSLQKLAYQTDGMFETIARSKLALASLPFFLGSMCLYVLWFSRRAQVIHAQWIPTAFVALPSKWLRRIPIVVSVRGSDLHSVSGSPPKTKVYRFLLNRLDTIVTVSKDFLRIMQDELRVTVPVRCLFNGVDESFFVRQSKAASRDKLGLDPDEPLLLFVGNMIELKGVDTLLEAFKSVLKSFPKARLAIAGEGPEITRFTEMARRLGISERVRFMDLVPLALIPQWMSAADLLVLPSRKEGRPNVVLEAMACELPVVASDAGGTKELIEHGKTGLLIKPGDASALAVQIVRVLADPNSAAEMARNARRFLITEGLTWNTHGKHLTELYASLEVKG